MRFFLLPPAHDGSGCWNELRLLLRCMVACFGLLTIWACMWVFYDECFLFVDFFNPEANAWRDLMYLIVGILIQGALGTYCFECLVMTTPTFPPPNVEGSYASIPIACFIFALGKRKTCYAIAQYVRMVVSMFASILCWVGGYGMLAINDEFESTEQYMVAYIFGGVTLVTLSGTLYPSINEGDYHILLRNKTLCAGWPEEVDLGTCSRSEMVWCYIRATMGLCGDVMAWVGWDGLMSVDSDTEQVLENDILMFWGGFAIMYLTRTLPQLVIAFPLPSLPLSSLLPLSYKTFRLKLTILISSQKIQIW